MKKRNQCFIDRKRIYDLGPLADLRALVERAYMLNGSRNFITESLRGRDVSYSCKDIYEDVRAFGTVMTEMGFTGSHVALIGENSYNWIISYLSVICGVGVIVPLDKELTGSDIANLLRLSDSSVVICSTTYLKDIQAHRDELPELKSIIVSDSIDPGEGLYSMQKLIARGYSLLDAGNTKYIDMPIDPEVCSAILFTSGTTGANKGVMLSHKNICANINSLLKCVPTENTSFSVLPFNHSFEFNCQTLTAIYLGVPIYICSSLRKTVQDMKRFKPGMTIVVPMFLETIHANIWREADKQHMVKKLGNAIRLSNALLKIGIDMRSTIFSQVKEPLGGNLSLVVCGGAPLSPELLIGLYEIGIDVINGYGITECAPIVTVNLNTDLNPGSVGKPIPGVEIKIDDPDEDGSGEILVRGDNVMLGYYKDEEATAASFTDGWFRTGDYGMLDKKGELVLTGRKKNIIILDNGKNVHPEEIETKIVDTLSYVREALVYAATKQVRDKQQLIAAMLHIDLEGELKDIPHEELEKKVTADIRLVNRMLPTYKQIQSVVVTEEDFTKTTTMKVRRDKVLLEHKNENGINI